MKKEKLSVVLYYIVSACFYVAAIVNFLGTNDSGMGVVWLCLGSAMLALGSARNGRSGQRENAQEDAEGTDLP